MLRPLCVPTASNQRTRAAKKRENNSACPDTGWGLLQQPARPSAGEDGVFYNPGLMRWDEAERTASATQRVLEPPSQWGDGAAGGRSRATGTSLCLLVKEPPRGRSQSQGLEKSTACSRSSRSQQTPCALPSWHTQAPRSRLRSQVKQCGGRSERPRSKHGSKWQQK